MSVIGSRGAVVLTALRKIPSCLASTASFRPSREQSHTAPCMHQPLASGMLCGWQGAGARMRRRDRVLLSEDFARVELDEHGTVRFHFLKGDRQPEVVEEKELQLEMIEFRKW